MKVCSKCLIEKEISEFRKDLQNKDGHKHICKECIKEYNIKNKEKIQSYRKEYYIKNREKENEYKKNRRLNDPIFKLKDTVRRRLNQYLKCLLM